MSRLDQEATTTTGQRAGRPAPSGFTLVELLVVIMIIAMLAALVTPAVMRAQATARNAAIKAEIDMLHMAIMNYKNEYGSFPPSLDDALNATSPATKHLSRLFPRCSNPTTQLTGALPSGAIVSGTNAIAFWLKGFTDDPSEPLLPVGSRKKLYDFDMSRVNQSTGAYFPSGKSGSPYLYIDSTMYATAPYAGGSSASPGAFRVTYAGDPTPFANAAQAFANADTFQILCAGRDETFGTDDDLSNFWPGTRRDYLDSLKQ
jgi:prepilin-type N-terminal cleavage/methylation domain-containing protein